GVAPDQRFAASCSNKALKGSYYYYYYSLLWASPAAAAPSERAQLDREAGNPNESRAILLWIGAATGRVKQPVPTGPRCLVFGAFLMRRPASLSPRADLFATNTLSVCVSQCPNRPIDSLEELKQVFLRDKINYCSYDFPLLSANATHQNKFTGPPVPTRQLVVWSLFMAAASRQEFGLIYCRMILSTAAFCLARVSGRGSNLSSPGRHAMLVSCRALPVAAAPLATALVVFADQKEPLDALGACLLALVTAVCLCVVVPEPAMLALYSFKRQVRWVSVPHCALAANCHLPVASSLFRFLGFGIWRYISTSALPAAGRDDSQSTMNNSLIRELLRPCLAMDRAVWVSCLWIFNVPIRARSESPAAVLSDDAQRQLARWPGLADLVWRRW
uniref:Mannosyltransferase n=1 Tax=Macrostomum lignano TaxID=282301 RepID=A0A1I8FJX9_9PLAT